MLHDMQSVIGDVSADVPERLWSPRAVGQMRSLVERFPATPNHQIGPVRFGVVGLEFRLAADAEQVDLSFPILKEDRDVIVALGDDPDEGSWMRDDPVWRRVLQLCRLWAEDPEISPYIKLLWLEMDVDEGVEPSEGTDRSDVPPPGIFVGFHREVTTELSPAGWRRLASRTLATLTGTEPAAEILVRFERCRQSLPEGAFVQYAGLMLSRGADLVRFVFGDVAEDELPSFLATCGWPGDPEDLRRQLSDAATSTDGERLHGGAAAVQFDIGRSSVSPRLGLEYVFDRSNQVEQGVEERPFLEHLVTLGLCSEEKLQEILELPGRRMEPWKNDCMIGHVRQVHHVKLVVLPDGVSEAKVYFWRSVSILQLEPDVDRPRVKSGPIEGSTVALVGSKRANEPGLNGRSNAQ